VTRLDVGYRLRCTVGDLGEVRWSRFWTAASVYTGVERLLPWRHLPEPVRTPVYAHALGPHRWVVASVSRDVTVALVQRVAQDRSRVFMSVHEALFARPVGDAP
jgi:hypothetical protein